VGGVRDHGGRRRIAIAEAGNGREVTGKEREREREKGKVEMVMWVLLLFSPWVDRYCR
jgi:hypothetical protein